MEFIGEFNGVKFRLQEFGTINTDPQHGETRECMYRVEFFTSMMNPVLDDGIVDPVTQWMKEQDWDAFTEQFAPETHCHHSYDCCGNWYYSRGCIIDIDNVFGTVYILHGSHLNV